MLSRAGWRQRTLDSIPGTWYQAISGNAAGDRFDGQTKTE